MVAFGVAALLGYAWLVTGGRRLFDDLDFGGSDALKYRAIAAGHIAQVVQPFTARAAFAITAGHLSRWGGFDQLWGFVLLAWGSLMVFAASLDATLRRLNVRGWHWLAMLFATPFMARTFVGVELPDACVAAATAAVFAALLSGRWALAAILAGLAVALRETGVILVAFVLVLVWRAGRRQAVALGVAAALGGWACSSHFSHAGLANVHDMPPLIYLALKIPVNLMVEVLGFDYWTDSWNYVCHPTFAVIAVPHWLPLGHVHRIGVCFRGAAAPLTNLFILCTTFGVLPAMLIAARAGFRGPGTSPVLRATLWYGLLMFMLGVSSGRAVNRLADYGWPAFLIATPAAMRLAGLELRWPLLMLQPVVAAVGLLAEDFTDAAVSPAALATSGLLTQLGAYLLARRSNLTRAAAAPLRSFHP